MVLKRCEKLWGEANLMYGDPPLRVVENATYLPYQHKASWGIFDEAGCIVQESVDYRGPQRETPLQDLNFARGQEVLDFAELDEYIYFGFMNTHFGHFLINTLARLWPLFRGRNMPTPLFHGDLHHAGQFAFVRKILSGLEIELSNCVSFEKPTRIKRLLVPASSIHEQYFAYTIYGDLCRLVTERLGLLSGIQSDRRPVYFSKTKLPTGVGCFADEAVIENILGDEGVRIVYPESEPFEEQIRIMSQHDLCSGTTGSAFHNVIFASEGRKLVALNPIPDVNSNFVLLDKLSQSKATYLYPEDLTYASGIGHFLTITKTPHMREIAFELLDFFEQEIDWCRRSRR